MSESLSEATAEALAFFQDHIDSLPINEAQEAIDGLKEYLATTDKTRDIRAGHVSYEY